MLYFDKYIRWKKKWKKREYEKNIHLYRNFILLNKKIKRLLILNPTKKKVLKFEIMSKVNLLEYILFTFHKPDV